MNKKFIENFLIFYRHNLNNLQEINTSINNFLKKLNENVFEIPLKMGKMEYKQRVLMAFCKYKFYNNFTPYTITYFPKIYPYVYKKTYSKKIKK